jgi:TRAP-type C4-dicarboxylate transport system permease small subunit
MMVKNMIKVSVAIVAVLAVIAALVHFAWFGLTYANTHQAHNAGDAITNIAMLVLGIVATTLLVYGALWLPFGIIEYSADKAHKLRRRNTTP